MMDSARRRRFIAAFNAKPWNGDRQKFMKETGYSKGRVAQFMDERQPFGERAAREVAVRMGLNERAFETDDAVTQSLSAEALGLAMLYDSMTPAERARLKRLYLAAQDEVRGTSIFGELGDDEGQKAV